MKWSDGIERADSYRGPGTLNFVREIMERRLHDEWLRLTWENEDLRARIVELDKQMVKAAGAE